MTSIYDHGHAYLDMDVRVAVPGLLRSGPLVLNSGPTSIKDRNLDQFIGSSRSCPDFRTQIRFVRTGPEQSRDGKNDP